MLRRPARIKNSDYNDHQKCWQNLIDSIIWLAKDHNLKNSETKVLAFFDFPRAVLGIVNEQKMSIKEIILSIYLFIDCFIHFKAYVQYCLERLKN